MGRVDEAFRRASAQPIERGADVGEIPSGRTGPVDHDVAALAREPYPLEAAEPLISDRTPAPSLAAERPAPAPAATADVAPDPSPAPRQSIFARMNGRVSEKVVIDTNILPASREQYRRLAATLHHAQADNGLRVVMVASAVQGEGKTLTSTNLALTLSESYQRQVLLVDADLRRPALHSIFAVDNSSGLSEGLLSRQQQRLPVRQLSPRLALLPAGRPNADPMAGLTSARMKRVIEEARASFDWVIVDTPPVVLLTDANLLSAMVDGVILVVRAGTTANDLVNRAIAAIGRERLLGVVLNGASETPQERYGYYNYYDAAATDLTAQR
jgi:capsular exopolysaccharide synthesis family protein